MTGASAASARTRLLERVGAYVALTKPRIIELLLVTTVPGMILAAGGWPSWPVIVITLVGGACAAAAASVLNCIYDRDIDAVMARTQSRPLVSGAVSVPAARIFAGILTVLSVALLAIGTTLLAAAMAAASIAWYGFLYTRVLKRRTRHSTLLGGFPGAAPVLIGYAAVASNVSMGAVVFFSVVFCWQLPHFWSLATKYREDYAQAGVPMLPVVETIRNVALCSLLWTYATVAVSLLLPVANDRIGVCYLTVAGLAGLWFLLQAHQFFRRARRSPADPRPMLLFHTSVAYMCLLPIGLVVDILL